MRYVSLPGTFGTWEESTPNQESFPFKCIRWRQNRAVSTGYIVPDTPRTDSFKPESLWLAHSLIVVGSRGVSIRSITQLKILSVCSGHINRRDQFIKNSTNVSHPTFFQHIRIQHFKMESAFSYIAGLVEAFEDVGKTNRNEKNESLWNQGAMPSCNLNMANSTEDYCGAFDLEHNLRRSSFEDDDDDEYGRIRETASNQSNRRRGQRQRQRQRYAIESVPSLTEKKSFSEMIKAKRLSLLQSFSAGSSSRNPPDVTKSRSSLSNTTNESDTDVENDQTDFSWAQSLSDDDDERFKGQRHKYLPPPPTNPHIQWFAHGLMWTCLAIAFGWMGVGFSYAARQSTHFVATKEPMYLDPRYETIPAIGMIQMELCFNRTHLDILEDLNDNGFLLEPGLELGTQPRTRTVDSAPEYNDDDDDDDIGPSVVDLATTPCIIHRLTSDDVHDDVLYQLSRSMAFLAILLGGFITACLTLSIFWKTINLRPIGAGFLVAYFMQSFTFLIFDSNLCKDNMGCKMSRGGACSMVASICWIVACATCARMEKKKIKIEARKEAEIEEMLRQRRKSERKTEHQVHPRHIAVEKEIQPKTFGETEERRIRKKKTQQEHSRPPKPKRIAKEHRASTAETAINSDDEDSDAVSQKILQDLNELNQDPIYIPALPETSPDSERSMRKADQKSSSKKFVSNTTKKEVQEGEKSTKARSRKSKPKGKNTETQNILEDLGAVESSSTNHEETKKPKKRKPKGATKSSQERSRSPSKSIDMAGDVVDTILADKIKSSTRVSDRKANENSSSRSRRSKSNPQPRSAEMRASLRKSIEEGKHYEL